jgi:zinc transporter ZupT
VLVFKRPSALTLDALLGFTAGVMLAATAFSLLVPALDRGSLGEVLLGFALGSGFIAALDLLVPHAHTRFRERGRPAAEELAARDRATLLLSALTIHNLPEGLAVGSRSPPADRISGCRLRSRSGSRTSPRDSRPPRPCSPPAARRGPRRAWRP